MQGPPADYSVDEALDVVDTIEGPIMVQNTHPGVHCAEPYSIIFNNIGGLEAVPVRHH